jgi:hypothetical protein
MAEWLRTDYIVDISYSSCSWYVVSQCVWGAQVIEREELCVRPAFCPELQLAMVVGKISGL